MWSTTGYRRLVRSSGWYDLMVTAAFATPWSFAALYAALGQLSQQWGLEGEVPVFLAYPEELRHSKRVAAFREFVSEEIFKYRKREQG